MIGSLKIGSRLWLMLIVQFLVLLLVGAIVFFVLRFAVTEANSLSERVGHQAKLIALSEGLRSDLVSTVHALNVGTANWTEAKENLTFAKADFEAGWENFLGSLQNTPDERELVDDVLAPHIEGIRLAFSGLDPIVDKQSRARLSLFVSDDLDRLVSPFLNALVASTSLQQLDASASVAAAADRSERFLYLTSALVGLGMLLTALLGFLVYRSIVRPLKRITSTVELVSNGDFAARTAVRGRDELGLLGGAFDELLDDRVQALAKSHEDNEQLNASVISLLEAVSLLSQRDLRVRVPVTEDIIGPVADSLNLLTTETAHVLQGVRGVSDNVAQASHEVKAQSDRVRSVASEEQIRLKRTAAELGHAVGQMTEIARLAKDCAASADRAIDSTQTAMDTVTSTVTGINGIRDTIREAEKRIKRLGERSQEVSGVVDLINTIAERTHILALNASMHAASAGEAGRGFAVVADEVQRLAENAREATSQIATLVRNIQVETADTVTTMNGVISQVVSGSELAEQAGQQMRDTRNNTADLVAMVQRIAIGSQQQVQASKDLEARAQEIQRSTEDTSRQLEAQSEHTTRLVEQSQQLTEAVSVFVLPDDDTDEPDTITAEHAQAVAGWGGDIETTVTVFPNKDTVTAVG